jgi:hypothetical protein
MDIEFKAPLAPDIVVNNDKDETNLDILARDILNKLSIGKGYRYSAGNRLEHSEKYEFSEYEGFSFLKAYSSKREETRKILKEKVEKLERLYAEEENVHPWTKFFNFSTSASIFFQKELNTENTFEFRAKEELDTSLFLLSNLNSLITDSLKVEKELVLKLIKKFEVSKKLYDKYTLPGLKKKGAGYQELKNYALFSILLSSLYAQVSEEEKLIFLNSILKLNDLLESVVSELTTPLEYYLTLISLEQESKLYNSLYQDKIK